MLIFKKHYGWQPHWNTARYRHGSYTSITYFDELSISGFVFLGSGLILIYHNLSQVLRNVKMFSHYSSRSHLSTRIDLAVLLGKTPSSMENDSSNLDPSQAPSLAQPLVFSNSKQSAISQPASGNTFSHHNMVSRKHGIS